jgi:ACS family pantothenate transporter-like MFS transporter
LLTIACLVTPGNRAAAVVAGLNVIVFIIITVLAHREKIQKKRAGQVEPVLSSSDSPTPSIGAKNEKLPAGSHAVEVREV